MQKQSLNKKKVILGVTGSFGSGKTTVAKIFQSFGAQIIDADKIAHSCISPRRQAYKKIIDTFDKDIFSKDRTINRRKLAWMIFNNKNLLRRLNNIIHPEVIKIIKSQIKASRVKIIVLDAPLLLEAGLRGIVDKLIVVKITQDIQITRVQNKTALSKADILKRIRAQISQNVKLRFANFVIDNSGTIQNTKKQVIRIWKKLQPLKH